MSIPHDLFLRSIRASSPVAGTYAFGEYLTALGLRASGRTYDSLQHLCDARRRVPDMAVTNRHGELIREIIDTGAGVSHNRRDGALREAFRRSRAFDRAKAVFRSEPVENLVRLRHSRPNSSPARQGNLIILKPADTSSGEKGVLLIKYTPTFEAFAATFDLSRIAQDYRLVLEPSWYRNVEAALLLLAMSGTHVLQAAHNDDQALLEPLATRIRLVNMGSGDWMDPQIFSPPSKAKHQYDAVMVASWSRFKRHKIMFQALRRLRDRGRTIQTALIGYPGDLSLTQIQNMAARFGVQKQCQFFQAIPPEQVAEIVGASTVAVHLSAAEGTNRAAYEAWLCNTPLIVYRHCMGFRTEYVNEHTGKLADDNELANTIEYCIDKRDTFSPRDWLLQRSGYKKSTVVLNSILREIALELEEPWTRDIVEKKNGPHLQYANDSDRIALEPEYERLRLYLS